MNLRGVVRKRRREHTSWSQSICSLTVQARWQPDRAEKKTRRHYSSSSLIWSLQTDTNSDINTWSSLVSWEVVVRVRHTEPFSEGLCFMTPFWWLIVSNIHFLQRFSLREPIYIKNDCWFFLGGSACNLSLYSYSWQKIMCNAWSAIELLHFTYIKQVKTYLICSLFQVINIFYFISVFFLIISENMLNVLQN